MRINIPGVADNLTYCVIAAFGIDVIATIVLVSMGWVPQGLVPLALAAGMYWFVYRNLAEDIAAARPAAAIIASAHLAFAINSAIEEDLFGFMVFALASACLGYIFVELGQRSAEKSLQVRATRVD